MQNNPADPERMPPPSVWHLKGVDQSGPNVVVLGGTHGDELPGIELLRTILRALDVLHAPAGICEDRRVIGNLYLGFGNPEAIIRRSRGASKERDLNRSFSRSELLQPVAPDESMDFRRARELAPLFERTDFLFDIHATSSESPPFVCMDQASPEHESLCRLIPVRYILTDPNAVLPRDLGLRETCTTDYYVNAFGGSEWSSRKYGAKRGIALGYETGWETNVGVVASILPVVARLLKTVGVVNDEFLAALGCTIESIRALPISHPAAYALEECVPARQDGFAYADGMARGWQEVEKGQLLGSYPNGAQEFVSRSGMLLFPKAPHKVFRGRSLYYIAREV